MSSQSPRSSGIFDAITSKVGKATAACVAVAALGTAVVQLTDVWKKIFGASKEEKPSTSCFAAQLVYPREVHLSQWGSTKLLLKTRNDCKGALPVHVAFKLLAGQIRIEPLAGQNCALMNPVDPACWEQKTLEPGEVDWDVIPPRLTFLGDSLGDTDLVVNWIVYNSETKAQLHADRADFKVQDDRPASAPGLAKTALPVVGVLPAKV